MTEHLNVSSAPEPGPEGSLEPLHDDSPVTPQTPAPRRSAAARPDSPRVTFPQVARLELDDLVEQLVERATDVLNTQGRLRGLLTATRAIASDLSLPVLLRRIAEAACELVGARYGALSVRGPDNQLTDLITVGVDEQNLGRVGHYPHGVGILGRLIAEAQPLWLADLDSHPDFVGFPAGHPPMGSFLGVPIRVRDQVFGNIYLTEKTPNGAFSADDEELLGALAAAAGVAINNARLYEVAERRQLWATRSAEIVGELLTGGSDPLPLIANHARRVADADLAAILVPLADKPESLLVAAAEGVGAAALRGRLVPRDRSLAGQALAEDRDLFVEEVATSRRAYRSPDIPLGPAMVVRVRGAESSAVLSMGRVSGARQFDADERDMVAGFAGHAVLALELKHAREARRQLQQVEDRDRIARDLHDLVIQPLFATGLGINSLVGRTPEPAIRQRLGEFTDQVDDGSIRAIREAIFGLQHAPDDAGLSAKVFAVIRELTPGFGCDLRLDGPVDTLVSSHVAEHAAAVLREALTNAARHAQATTVGVSVSVADLRQLTVTVTDDGVGLVDPQHTSGLANMRSRADQLGGSCIITSPIARDGRGTRVYWAVPLDAE